MFRGLSVLGIAVFGVVFAPAAAQAQDLDAPCEIIRDVEFQELMTQLDNDFIAMEMESLATGADEIWTRIRCLERVAKPSEVARLARAKALLSFFQQDEEGVVRWGLAAEAAFPGYPWPENIAAEHPLRELITEAEKPAIVGPTEEHGIKASKNGGVFVDGHPILQPLAYDEIPHLVQSANHKGNVVDGYWQDGALFRKQYLTHRQRLAVPRWFEPEDREAAAHHAQMRYNSQEPLALEPLPIPQPQDVEDTSGGSSGHIGVVAGAGGGSQSLDKPGDYLAEANANGGVVGLVTAGAVPVSGPIGAYWDLNVPTQLGAGMALDAYVGGALDIGGPSLVGAVGTTTAQAKQGKDTITYLLPQPHLGVLVPVDMGNMGLDLALLGGWALPGMHLNARGLLKLGPLAAGPDITYVQGVLVEEGGAGRTVTTGRWHAGLRAGYAFGG